MATSDIQATEMTSILDTVKNLIPSNPVAAFANGNMLQVLVFAVIIGFTLLAIKEKGEPLLHLIDSCNEVCLKIISTVMYFTPDRCLLYHRTGCRSQRNQDDPVSGYPADHSVCDFLRICTDHLWRIRKNSW